MKEGNSDKSILDIKELLVVILRLDNFIYSLGDNL
jgi:hypothetical protein